MPECPTAVIVAKPKRQSWALEEAWDLAVMAHPESRAEPSRFPGVILVYTPDGDSRRLSIMAARGERGFIQRIVPAEICIAGAEKNDVVNAVESIIGRKSALMGEGRLRLIVSVRGEGKRVVDKRAIEEIVASKNLRIDRNARVALAVESVDSLFVIALGITRSCGPSCLLVYLAG